MNLVEKIESAPNLLVKALELVQKGWAIFPLHTARVNGSCSCGKKDCSSQGKHPRTRQGGKDASKDPSQIFQWWMKWPDSNIGLVTGAINDVVVIDIDPRHGGDQSWQHISEQLKLEPSKTVITGGGGFHVYYQHPKNKKIPNRANVLPGVDVRGDGGYVVAPPSTHVSGSIYHWDVSKPSEAISLPCDLEQLLIYKPKSLIKTHSSHKIGEGNRNTTLASVAGSLRKNGLDENAIHRALHLLNESMCETPLEIPEVSKIAHSISKYSTSQESNVEWEDPTALPEVHVHAQPLSESDIPEVLRPWVMDISHRMQVPPEFIAAPALCSFSAVIGRQVGIYPKQKDDWLVVPNLWGAVVARPGFFKSPAIAEALKPLENLVKEERRRYESALIVVKAKEDIVKARIEGIKESVKKAVRKGNDHEVSELQGQLENCLKELDESQVTEKRFKTNDATIEKIGALMLENPNGLMVFRDELSGWLKSLQKHGREGDREFYLEAWNGYGSYTVDRIGRGTLHIPSLCLSVFGGLQPGKLDSYINSAIHGGEGDDGLLQRFQILVYPNLGKKWKNIDRKPDEKAIAQVVKLFEKCAELKLPSQSNSKASIQGLHFSGKAQEVFDDWRQGLEVRLREEDCGFAAFESHLAKFRSLVPSLALLFHFMSDSKDLEVGEKSIRLAIRWGKILEAHARKVYSGVIHSDIKAAHLLAAKIKSGMVPDRTTVRSVYRKCWSGLETSSNVDRALSVLEDCHWLRVEQVKAVYRNRDEIHLNPKLKIEKRGA